MLGGEVRGDQVAVLRQGVEQAGENPVGLSLSGTKRRTATSISAIGWPKSRMSQVITRLDNDGLGVARVSLGT